MSESRFGLDSESLKTDLERVIRSTLAGDPSSRPISESAKKGPQSAGFSHSLDALHASAARVGQQPPQPPTWRARLGAAAIRLMRRALFWYTPQISQFHSTVIETFEAQSRELGALRSALQEMRVDFLEPRLAAVEARCAAIERTLRGMRDDVPEDLYRRFEDAFRGDPEEIRTRLKVYIEFVQGHHLGTPAMPILDLGCGRGEWLDLLRAQGLCARGADSSALMVAQCRAAGLDVAEANLLDLLKELPDASVGMITMFHVVEHLPVVVLLEALRHSVRVLKPGGAVIFETPNPENLRVGAHTFYTDLTHRHPIPPETLRFLGEALGLTQVEIRRLHPETEAALAESSELERRVNQVLYGPRDYALLGRKLSDTMNA